MTPQSSCDFRESGCRLSYTLLRGAGEVLPIIFTLTRLNASAHFSSVCNGMLFQKGQKFVKIFASRKNVATTVHRLVADLHKM